MLTCVFILYRIKRRNDILNKDFGSSNILLTFIIKEYFKRNKKFIWRCNVRREKKRVYRESMYIRNEWKQLKKIFVEAGLEVFQNKFFLSVENASNYECDNMKELFSKIRANFSIRGSVA